MNQEQRNRIAKILEALYCARDDIEEIKSEEEDKYDNLPEQLQDSSKGEQFQENIDQLDDVISSLEDAIDYLEGVQ